MGFLVVRAGSPTMNLWLSNEDVFMVLCRKFSGVHFYSLFCQLSSELRVDYKESMQLFAQIGSSVRGNEKMN